MFARWRGPSTEFPAKTRVGRGVVGTPYVGVRISSNSWINIKSLSENLIGIEKSEPTLDMRVVTLSPAKEGSP